jgi:heme/copper-type cytochrome/quinol oxidase subunit 3
LLSLGITICLAILFSFLQYVEYSSASFTLVDSIYGSTFYLTTGIHAIHVILGTLFLLVCLYRIFKNHFSKEHHNGFEFAIIY